MACLGVLLFLFVCCYGFFVVLSLLFCLCVVSFPCYCSLLVCSCDGWFAWVDCGFVMYVCFSMYVFVCWLVCVCKDNTICVSLCNCECSGARLLMRTPACARNCTIAR